MSEWQQSSERAVLVALAKAAAGTTPAPWGWFDDNDDFTGYYVEWEGHPNGHQFIIARVQDRDNAESEANAMFIAAARNATDAIDKALALADRAAELEAALAEERAEAAVVQAWGESEAQSKVELFFMLSQHRAARAAHRNAAQQEGQGDDK